MNNNLELDWSDVFGVKDAHPEPWVPNHEEGGGTLCRLGFALDKPLASPSLVFSLCSSPGSTLHQHAGLKNPGPFSC